LLLYKAAAGYFCPIALLLALLLSGPID